MKDISAKNGFDVEFIYLIEETISYERYGEPRERNRDWRVGGDRSYYIVIWVLGWRSYYIRLCNVFEIQFIKLVIVT